MKKHLFGFREAEQLRQLLEGWEDVEVESLLQPTLMAEVRDVINGKADIIRCKHLIDGDADPFVPIGLKVVRHDRIGTMQYTLGKVVLFQTPKQHEGGYVQMPHMLAGVPQDAIVLNANFMDYFLAHPHLIPRDWDGKNVWFPGTIYIEQQSTFGHEYARGLCLTGRLIDIPPCGPLRGGGYGFMKSNEQGSLYSCSDEDYIALWLAE